jgi:TM2 domain-containing membrane protein YozV
MSNKVQYLLPLALGLLGVGLEMTASKHIGVALIVLSLGWIWWLLLPTVADRYLKTTQPRPPFWLWVGWIGIGLIGLFWEWQIIDSLYAIAPQMQVSSSNQQGGVTTGHITGDVTINSDSNNRKIQL